MGRQQQSILFLVKTPDWQESLDVRGEQLRFSVDKRERDDSEEQRTLNIEVCRKKRKKRKADTVSSDDLKCISPQNVCLS